MYFIFCQGKDTMKDPHDSFWVISSCFSVETARKWKTECGLSWSGRMDWNLPLQKSTRSWPQQKQQQQQFINFSLEWSRKTTTSVCYRCYMMIGLIFTFLKVMKVNIIQLCMKLIIHVAKKLLCVARTLARLSFHFLTPLGQSLPSFWGGIQTQPCFFTSLYLRNAIRLSPPV